MKKILFCTFFLLVTMCLYAQENKKDPESAKPTFGVTVNRVVDAAKINGKYYYNVAVEFKASDIMDWSEGVKIKVKHRYTDKKLYKKRFSNSYLYVYSDKSIQVGKGNATTEVICQKDSYGDWIIEIEEDGIY